MNEDQEELRRRIISRPRCPNEERKALEIRTRESAETYLEDLNSTLKKYNEKHEKGCGLYTKQYQDVGAKVKGFLTNFSPILEVVENSGAPYSQAIFGIITLVFFVSLIL